MAKSCYTKHIIFTTFEYYIIFNKFDCLVLLIRNYEHNYEIKKNCLYNTI